AGDRDHPGRVSVRAPPGVGLELLAADATGADHGLAPVPAVAGVVDQLRRLPDDRHLLHPAARLGRAALIADADAGNVQVLDGGVHQASSPNRPSGPRGPRGAPGPGPAREPR